MDDIDIDNAEDLNELESRLYAQIHHESTDDPNIESEKHLGIVGSNVTENTRRDQTFETSATTNRILARRYWASNGPQEQAHQRFLRNPFKTSNNANRVQKQQSPLNRIGNPPNMLQTDKNTEVAQSNNTGKQFTSETDTNEVSAPKPTSNENIKSKNPKPGRCIDKLQTSPDFKLNPAADWMKRKTKNNNKKAINKQNHVNSQSLKNSSINIKPGLFARQERKLEKAKRIEEKKQKSKKCKSAKSRIDAKTKTGEIIDLDSDNDSDSSDVVLLPIEQPPVFTIDDSGDENDNGKVPITMEHEENAIDSTDVQMSSITSSFIKPLTSSTLAVSGDKRLENSSRCTSPCSILSSDDFIGQRDRSRLLETTVIADDEDLLVLTSDINSLLEVPDNSTKLREQNPRVSKEANSQGANANTTGSSLEFATPAMTDSSLRAKNYRVDHGQYKALDVYESESDITDSVYSKGVKKSTVIRQIDTSSDEVEDISCCSQKTKRLRKRRASGSNKESEPNTEAAATSSSSEEADDDNITLRTPIPFIAKGIAVERYKPRKRSRTLSSTSPVSNKRRSTIKQKTANNNMSDTEFINTLTNLAQGQEDEQQSAESESETESAPTAREIAEKVLSQHGTVENSNELADDNLALPTDIINELDKVFETIDQLDREDPNEKFTANDNTVNVSDSSDSDRENNFVYKSLPDEDAQIIEYVPEKSTAKARIEKGSPVYNIIYSRGVRKPGGVGWNDEMRKFYNNSWNGERFTLRKALQNMNPDKKLWKINPEDRSRVKLNRHTGVKCSNCCEYGHMFFKCKNPKKPLICYMCGDSGHREPRCPNTMCLRCGNKTQVFTKICNACSYQDRLTCPICKIRGHSLDYCPDKWRRYHSTTEGNTHPNSNVDYNPRRFCCICGGSGHLSDNCRNGLLFLQYPVVASTVKSHQKSYSDVVIKTPYNGIALNLMYKPCEEYKFDLVKQTSLDNYYCRFLKAVGLDYMFKQKTAINSVTVEIADTTAKKAKRLSKKYEANPYFKAAKKQNVESLESAPNQVPEITESGNTDQQDSDKHLDTDVINIEENSDSEVELIDSITAEEDDFEKTIQLNTINNPKNESKCRDEKFKSPKYVKSVLIEKTICKTNQTESTLPLDSDSNYSFSEHFDVLSKGENVSTTSEISASKSRHMEPLPDFIPLMNSRDDQNKQQNNTNRVVGMSETFVAADTDSDDNEMNVDSEKLDGLQEMPCEAKIYLTQLHSKYLLSSAGNEFLINISRAHQLKARLDFTSVGHVLVIFGSPTNQNNFQKELLAKYHELLEEKNQKLFQGHLNVPKRTFVLIKFLRENICQLLNHLGNVNKLLKRLNLHERKQRSKAGLKLVEKVRKSLNMILVGQAGLQNGNMHLDKLLLILKKLLHEASDDFVSEDIRSEITDHYKFIFTPYRHDNYKDLVETYNKMMSQNRMPQLNIDPVLLGLRVLDTTLSAEQRQNLEQTTTNKTKTNALNPKNMKPLKRKQNEEMVKTSLVSDTLSKTKPTTMRAMVTTNASLSKKSDNNKPKNVTANKSKQTANTCTPTSNGNETAKQQQTTMPPPPFVDPKKHSTVSTTIQNMTVKWKSTYDNLLTQISSKNSPLAIGSENLKMRDSVLPSTFWSRESIPYLDSCSHTARGNPKVMEKLQRVQTKAKNGQLSYNDYLVVMKLHNALKGK